VERQQCQKYCTISFNSNGDVTRYTLIQILEFERTGGGALRWKKFEQGGDEPGLNQQFPDRMTGAQSTSLASITVIHIWHRHLVNRGENLVKNMHYLMYQPVNGKQKKLNWAIFGWFWALLCYVLKIRTTRPCALYFRTKRPALRITFELNEIVQYTIHHLFLVCDLPVLCEMFLAPMDTPVSHCRQVPWPWVYGIWLAEHRHLPWCWPGIAQIPLFLCECGKVQCSGSNTMRSSPLAHSLLAGRCLTPNWIRETWRA
jgi:hypothetical protein